MPGAARIIRAFVLGAASLVAASRGALAQAAADGAGVLLRLHPHVGDTLHTRLEQQTEVSGPPGRPGLARRPLVTTVTVSARTIVKASRASTTTVLTIVDSAEVHGSDTRSEAMSAKAERALRGQQLELQLAEDGSVQSAKDARGVAVPRDLAEAMAAMPPVFPHRAVVVGEKWEREMPLPSAGPLGAGGSAHIRAQFRLDSLGRNGGLAYVSMHGEIVPDGDERSLQLTGSVTGAMRVDRARGWMTDSRFAVMLKSMVTPPVSAGMAPMQFVTRITQHLRTMDKR